MCGRFTLTADPNEIQAAFPWLSVPEGIQPRYNIAPTQPIAVVANDGKNKLDFYIWGLIPSWAKDPTIGNRLINARAETLAEKPAFRAALRRRRCLVLADGFYEWRQEPGRKTKVPMYIRLRTGKPFAFAGLWETWESPDGSTILSGTIITTEPNLLMQDIHNRMPVIVHEADYRLWLTQDEVELRQVEKIFQPYPSAEMVAQPVSSLVNSPANESPDLIKPLVQ
jgi:putative SOS response-associated peptidase YedK